MFEALLLHPGDVLHVLHVVQAVAHRGLRHGRGGGQTVKVLHQNILRGLPRQSGGHITARGESINNLAELASLSPTAITIIQYLSVEVPSPLSPHNVKVN